MVTPNRIISGITNFKTRKYKFTFLDRLVFFLRKLQISCKIFWVQNIFSARSLVLKKTWQNQLRIKILHQTLYFNIFSTCCQFVVTKDTFSLKNCTYFCIYFKINKFETHSTWKNQHRNGTKRNCYGKLDNYNFLLRNTYFLQTMNLIFRFSNSWNNTSNKNKSNCKSVT